MHAKRSAPVEDISYPKAPHKATMIAAKTVFDQTAFAKFFNVFFMSDTFAHLSRQIFTPNGCLVMPHRVQHFVARSFVIKITNRAPHLFESHQAFESELIAHLAQNHLSKFIDRNLFVFEITFDQFNTFPQLMPKQPFRFVFGNGMAASASVAGMC